MTYELCRTDLITRMTGLTIDGAVKIRRVYADPPGRIQDLPCAVLYGSEGRAEYAFGGQVRPDERHTERIRIYLSEADSERQSELVRKARRAVLDAIEADGGLGGYGWITDLSWGYPSGYPSIGANAVGFDLLVSFLVTNP